MLRRGKRGYPATRFIRAMHSNTDLKMLDVIMELMAESSPPLSAIAGAIFGTWVLLSVTPRRFSRAKAGAAFSIAYQAYYDIWLHGQFFKQVDYLHEKYGPVVRINPRELHINDPTFIDEVYAGNNKKRDKYKWQGRAVLLPDSLVATEPHDLHRKRRAAVNPYISKVNIRKLDPVVHESVESIIKRLDESANPGAKPFHTSWLLKQQHVTLSQAQLLVLAGQDTTAYTLSSLTHRILADPNVFNQLKQELETALPHPNQPLTSAHLEQLPCLTGIIQGGICLHPGALVRQSRVATKQDLVYPHPNGKKSWVILAGTPIAMDSRWCNLNPKFFPDPHAFIPERWIENPRLDRYMLGFLEGARIRPGMGLACSGLYMILAGTFRRYELDDGTGKQKGPTLSLHETTFERDVDVKYDCLVPFPTQGSKGVQVKVRHGTGTKP
ncbi:hypothetical protein FQN54_006170 [Arachnomyces sp. PD_36]|nr:hypothetical protein FQN54_006170 [Arachnomyces sp. PD_36]